MENQILFSKIRVPKLRKKLVSRPRLIEKLNAGLSKKITLISAPAGFGKTTLVTQWLQNVDVPTCWLSLDIDDNDLISFLTYLFWAIQQIQDQVDEGILSILRSPQPGADKAAIIALLNQIEDIPIPFIFVLDDFQLIEEKRIHQAVDFMIRHLPSNLHLVIITRADPPLQLAREKTQGMVNEIRLSDLRFSSQDISQFFNESFNNELSVEDITRLGHRTEGWITGMQMAAVSMKNQQDISGFVRSFSGSNRYIFDFLIEEVLKQQSVEIQEFLLKTSILENLTGSLCQSITNNSNSAKILDNLERSNLFVIPLDEDRLWFRYHRLFSDLLQTRLRQIYPDEIKNLHLKASNWYEENSIDSQAVEHAINAEDYSKAANIMEREAEAALIRSEISTLLRWGRKLPKNLLEKNTNLDFLIVWARMMIGEDPKKIKERLGITKEDQAWLRGRKETLLAFLAITELDIQAGRDHALLALRLLPKDDDYFLNIAMWIEGISEASLNNLRKAKQSLEVLLEKCESLGNIFSTVITASQLGRINFRLGNLSGAMKVYQRALDAGRGHHRRLLPIASEALVGMAELHLEINALDEANDYAMEGIELSRYWRDLSATEGYLTLALVKQAEGYPEAAQDAINKSQQLANTYKVSDLDLRKIALWQAKLWLAQGKIDLLTDWATHLDWNNPEDIEAVKKKDGMYYYLYTRESLVVTQLKLLRGEFSEALSWLDKQLPMLTKIGKLIAVVELYLMKAIAFEQLGEPASAILELTTALDIAEPAGFHRVFLDQGEKIKPLLKSAQQKNIHADFIGRLLDTEVTSPKKSGDKTPTLLEPLSEREMEVLQWLQTNLTTPEIADELMIGVSTVRSHIKNIYGKLLAHKRSEAVNNAKALDLI